MSKKQRYEWVLRVRVSVDRSWVADGFEATKARMEEAFLESFLAYADTSEKSVSVKVLKKPTREQIRKEQGYE